MLISTSCIDKSRENIDTQPVQSDSNELIFTPDEMNAINQCSLKSIDDLVIDAFQGNAAALFTIGYFYLTGRAGLTIDSESANQYFAKSASLGFVPALDQLRAMHMLDLNNPFLMLVYVNLIVSLGHREYFERYNKLRDQLVKDGGLQAANEIEKIAAHKKTYISEFSKKVAADPKSFLKLLFAEGTISDEDVLFDNEFWMNILTGKITTGNIEKWLQEPENYCRKIERLAQKAKEQIGSSDN